MNTNETQHTIIQYLKKLIGGGDKDNSILADINKNISNIKINAESVNLNTDEVESKIQKCSDYLSLVNNKLTEINTKISDTYNFLITRLNTINNKCDNLSQIYDSLYRLENSVGVINSNTSRIISNTSYNNLYNIIKISQGNTNFINTIRTNVVLCNITNNTINVKIKPSSGSEFIEVPFAPGWNNIVVKEVADVQVDTLIAGY